MSTNQAQNTLCTVGHKQLDVLLNPTRISYHHVGVSQTHSGQLVLHTAVQPPGPHSGELVLHSAVLSPVLNSRPANPNSAATGRNTGTDDASWPSSYQGHKAEKVAKKETFELAFVIKSARAS